MHTLISYLIIFSLIFTYLVFYHNINFVNFLDVMHSAFTRQFIFELIPFIILFTTRELKFIDLETSSSFFNSVIGRSMIGMIAFTFATYSLSAVHPEKIGGVLSDPLNTSLRLNSFTNHVNGNTTLSNQTPNPVQTGGSIKNTIEPNERLLPYAQI